MPEDSTPVRPGLTPLQSREIDELGDLWLELRDELSRISNGRGSKGGGFERVDPKELDSVDRRLLVRSIFAGVEALAFRLKQEAYEHDELDPKLTIAERSLCLEEAYDLGERGTVETKAARLRSLPNLRFAFRVAAKVCAPEFELDVSGPAGTV